MPSPRIAALREFPCPNKIRFALFTPAPLDVRRREEAPRRGDRRRLHSGQARSEEQHRHRRDAGAPVVRDPKPRGPRRRRTRRTSPPGDKELNDRRPRAARECERPGRARAAPSTAPPLPLRGNKRRNSARPHAPGNDRRVTDAPHTHPTHAPPNHTQNPSQAPKAYTGLPTERSYATTPSPL